MDAELHLIEAARHIRAGEAEYAAAADEIVAAMREDPTLGYGRVADRVGKSKSWCQALVHWRTNGQQQDATPFARTDDQLARADETATKRAVARRPEVIVDALQEATPEVRDRIVSELTAQTTTPDHYRLPEEGTAGAYLRDPAPDPSEREIDHVAMRAAKIARDMKSRVERFGVWTMGDATNTIRDLDSAIADLAEVRAALIEHVNEEALS